MVGMAMKWNKLQQKGTKHYLTPYYRGKGGNVISSLTPYFTATGDQYQNQLHSRILELVPGLVSLQISGGKSTHYHTSLASDLVIKGTSIKTCLNPELRDKQDKIKASLAGKKRTSIKIGLTQEQPHSKIQGHRGPMSRPVSPLTS